MGLDHICEYSGEFVGPDMEGYRKDFIQIHPKFKKHFRGQRDHVLHVFEPESVNGEKLQWYVLEIKDKDHKGIVQGRYLNFTKNGLTKVRRKLKRALGVPEINVRRHAVSYEDFSNPASGIDW